MATTRLTEGQENALRECLDALAPILAYSHLYGGREIMQARDLERRLKNLFSPEDPGTLEAEARAFIAVNAPVVEANKQRTRAREEEAAAIAAERQAARDGHRAEVAARIEKAEERRMQRLAQLRGESDPIAEAIAEAVG